MSAVAVLPRMNTRTAKPKAAPAVAGRARAIQRQAVAGLLVNAIIATLSGLGHMLDSGSAFALEARAAALHARWLEMLAEGIPSSDLELMQREWAAAERITIFSVGATWWWPGSSMTIDSWQSETDLIWSRNVSIDRDGARVALYRLQRALAPEPLGVVKERLQALAAASTPGDYQALRFDWELQTKLIPVNKDIAASVGVVTDLASQTKALGILSDPAPDVLQQADSYTLQAAGVQLARAEQLVRKLHFLKQDLVARIDAATVTKQAFGAASDELSLAGAYGVGVSGFQSQIAADSRAFATATSAGQFNAITTDLNQVVSSMDHSIGVLRGATHIVDGVSFYYQTHTLSCEETATSMALTHQGIYLSQNQILAEMGADRRAMYVDGNGYVRWGNPYLSFVGNVNGSEHDYSGYGAFYPPLVRVARAHGASVIAYGSMSAEMIYARLTAGHPVVVWATWDWGWHPRHDYLSYDGQWIPWIGPYADAHVYTAVGVSPYAVLINDPIRGQYWVSRGAFEAAYSDFQEAIVFA